MREGRTIIPIVFSANEKYAPYIAVAICSIVKNASREYDYRFYILQASLGENIRLRLESISGEYYSVSCVNVTQWCLDSMYTAAYFSKEMYFRILIPELFPEYEKVLYLDCDTVVLGDISELYFTEFSGELLGGVRNLMHEKMRRYVKYSLGLKAEDYINSGVLLFCCTQCRNEKYTEKAFQLLEKRKDFIYPDQDLINVTCENRIRYLDPRWNFTWHYRHLQLSGDRQLHLTDEDMERFLLYEREPKLIHYTGEIKPWDNANKYLSDVFWQYAKDSVFFNLLIKRLAGAIDMEKVAQMREKVETLEDRIGKMEAEEKKREVAESLNSESSYMESPAQWQQSYVDKYNEVIGSFSYRLGRMLTFPFRKTRDAALSVRRIGLIRTLRLVPDKMKLYVRILTGRN